MRVNSLSTLSYNLLTRKQVSIVIFSAAYCSELISQEMIHLTKVSHFEQIYQVN